MISFCALATFLVLGLLAPLIAPYAPYDLKQVSLLDSFIPPGQGWNHILGTDEQGRDLLSTMLYGLRTSIFISVAAVTFSLLVGVALGLISGYCGGIVDVFLMRFVDVKLSFPSLLVALLVSGLVTAMVPPGLRQALQVYVLIFAIGFSSWPKFARTVRAGALAEREKEYVVAAQVMGVSPVNVVLTHIFPNVLPSLLVITTLTFGQAIVDEATISFLGVGLPPSQPSLGTLIRLGNEAIYGGEWWIAVFPTVVLAILVLGINLFGDWMRDAINPRLR